MNKSIIFISLLVFSSCIMACSCSLGDTKEKFESHQSVFEGSVSEIIYYDLENAFGDQVIRVKFDVIQQWKGNPNQTELLTVDNSRSCYGFNFKERRSYLVYAFIEGDYLNVWWCGGLLEKDASRNYKKEIQRLNKLSKKHMNSGDNNMVLNK